MQTVTNGLDQYVGTIWERNDGPYDKIFFELVSFNERGVWTFKILDKVRIKGNPDGTNLEGTNPNQDEVFYIQKGVPKTYKGGHISRLPYENSSPFFMSPIRTKTGNMGRIGKLPTSLCANPGPYLVHPQGWTPGCRTNLGKQLGL